MFVVDRFVDETLLLAYNKTSDALPHVLMALRQALVVDSFVINTMSLEYTEMNDAVSAMRMWLTHSQN